MEEYRQRSRLDADVLASYMHGSEENWATFQKFMEECRTLGLLPDLNAPEMSRIDQYTLVEKNAQLFKNFKGIDFMADKISPLFLYFTNIHVKGGVGLLMSLHLIKVLGTSEQVEKWATKLAKREWYGCYAQTELGHGSDVQNLKTLAVYDHETQEFTLNNPDIDSIKWWPGDLGMSANVAIVMSRIVSNGKDHGVYPLFVQIRDFETHHVLPGVELGDIGPKLGYASKDNGYLRFTNYKVSKDALLGRFYKIDQEGNIKTVGNPKIIYSSMLESRTALLDGHCIGIMKALQIVGRYSCLRKQFKDTQGNELPIIEYQMQKAKLLKFLSRGNAMTFARHRLSKFLKKNSDAVKDNNFSYLQEAHVYLSGYKAYFTWTGINCFSEMMQAAGGHGYSYYSGLPVMLSELFPDTILEGENSLLCLQVARHLLKAMKHVQEEKSHKIKGSTKYIKDIQDLLQYKLPDTKEQLCKHEPLLKAFSRVSCHFVRDAAMGMMTHIGNGLDPKEAWNTKLGMKLLNIGKIHTVYTIAYEATSEINDLPDLLIRNVLSDVLLYFIIEMIEEYSAFFIESDSINADQMVMLKEKREELVDTLSPHLLKLCEGLQIPDQHLTSAIGHSNGKPYENLYEWAKKYGSLNKYAVEGHPAIHQHKL